LFRCCSFLLRRLSFDTQCTVAYHSRFVNQASSSTTSSP
jgi:hypothetical protein